MVYICLINFFIKERRFKCLISMKFLKYGA